MAVDDAIKEIQQALNRGEARRVIALCSQILADADRSEEHRARARIYSAAARLRLGESDRAVEEASAALASLPAELRGTEMERLGWSTIGIAQRHLAMFESAIESQRCALAIARMANQKVHAAQALGNIANIYQILSDYRPCISHYLEALSLLEGDEEGIAPLVRASQHHNLSGVLLNKGLFEESMFHAMEAWSCFSKRDERDRLLATCMHVGNIRRRAGDPQGALRWFSMADEYCTPDSEYKATLEYNRSEALAECGMAGEALHAAHLSRELAAAGGDESTELYAAIMMLRLNHDTTEEDLRCLLPDVEARQEPELMAMLLWAIAERVPGFVAAEQELRRALKILKNSDAIFFTVKVLKVLADRAAKAKEWKKASETFAALSDLQDKLIEQTTTFRGVYVQERFSFTELQRRADRLVQANQELTDTLAQEREQLNKLRLMLVEKEQMLERLRSAASGSNFPELHTVLASVKMRLASESAWESLFDYIASASPGALAGLDKHCKSLTRTERRIAALFMLDFSTKEVAHLCAITTRTAQTHRGAIRAKLGLHPDDDLHAYLRAIAGL